MAIFRGGKFAGKYRARLAETGADVIRCQQLRYLAFVEERGLDPAGIGDPSVMRRDRDEFDSICRHVMIEETRTGKLVCCFRILPLSNGSEISRSYSAKYYELSKLATYPGRMV
ncbi:MAG: GNAT family N-acetyltransferase, partial [Paracoccaceae bacterium]